MFYHVYVCWILGYSSVLCHYPKCNNILDTPLLHTDMDMDTASSVALYSFSDIFPPAIIVPNITPMTAADIAAVSVDP